MDWNTSDLTEHSFDESSFTMTYGSESVTVVTKQGHMISAFLSGMHVPAPSNSTPKQENPKNQSNGVQNGLNVGAISDRSNSTHIKSVGKRVEKYEEQLQQSRPTIPPRPVVKPPKPAKPKHIALRPAKSVPMGTSVPPTSLMPLKSIPSRNAPAKVDIPLTESLYEAPDLTGNQKEDKKQFGKVEEAHYETSDTNFEELPKLTQRVPLLPPPRMQLLKKKPLANNAMRSVVAGHGIKKTHKSDSDIPVGVPEDVAETPESPVYDQLTMPEYAEPEVQSPLHRETGSRRVAMKRKSTTPSSQPPAGYNILSPPPPTSPAPPPPDPAMNRVVKFPRGSPSHGPPPVIPAPAPPIYDTLAPEDDLKEIEDVFGSKDLPLKVKYSCDTNPIYDTLAAIKVNSSLSNSDVTFHSFTSTLEKCGQKRKHSKSVTQIPPVPMSSPPQASSQNDFKSSELLSLLMKDPPHPHALIKTASVSEPQPKTSSISEPQEEKSRKISLRAKSIGQFASSIKAALKPPPLTNGTSKEPPPYSRLNHSHGKTQVPPPSQPSQEAPGSGATSDDNLPGHEYEVVDANPAKNPRGGKKVAPPKPPRARQRWEKKMERVEGKGHKAIKESDVLRVSPWA